MTSADEFVLQFALDRGLVAVGEVETVRRQAGTASGAGASATDVLAGLRASGALDSRELARALADRFGMPFVDFGEQQIPAEVLATVPHSFVSQHGVCPFDFEAGALRVAVADPLDLNAIDGLGRVASGPVVVCLAEADDLRRAVGRHYGDARDAMAALGADLTNEKTDARAAGGTSDAGDDAPIMRLVQLLVQEAARRRASDIHLEPLERRLRVRYRLDGVLVEVDSLPSRLHPALVSRLKIMANISIAEKRLPQDGRIRVVLGGRELDLRVSSLPTAHGESLVMRLLDPGGLRPGLPELGLEGDDARRFARVIAAPDGIVLVTGPTGSGKTTTLYACLHHLNQSDRKIITVEDPIEYQLSGINQVPVRAEVGLSFASALRAMLRQAPDIVMVGEIRDVETAEIAINASLTGHLVFSTLHTNDAPSAVPRLIDIGAKPFLVAAALRAVVAQRLVRRVCRACAAPCTPSAGELRALGAASAAIESARFLRGTGCVECDGTGYRGRLGIFEVFSVSDAIRAMIYQKAGAARLRTQGRQEGMRTLREDGMRKVLAGLTTIEEVLSVTVGDND